MLVGAGAGNVFDTVYTGGIDFAYKTIYLTADLDTGGRKGASGSWTGPNWTPIGGKFPMKPAEAAGDCMTLDTRFNGILDGQGHTIYNHTATATRPRASRTAWPSASWAFSAETRITPTA